MTVWENSGLLTYSKSVYHEKFEREDGTVNVGIPIFSVFLFNELTFL